MKLCKEPWNDGSSNDDKANVTWKQEKERSFKISYPEFQNNHVSSENRGNSCKSMK